MTPSFEHRRLQANGIGLHVATAGDPGKPAVMFLHGFPEGWFSWRSIMEALADDYFVLAPDLRGYGQSDKPAGGYGLMTLTEDVQDLVKQLTDRPITLVGHDWGGALTWLYGRNVRCQENQARSRPEPLFGGHLSAPARMCVVLSHVFASVE